jgi:hypothetical protein
MGGVLRLNRIHTNRLHGLLKDSAFGWRSGSAACGKILGVGFLKGHGFPAVPQVFEDDVRRGLEAAPFQGTLPLISTSIK